MIYLALHHADYWFRRYAWLVILSRCGCRRVLTFDSRPPHQIMTWVGLERYGYLEEAQRLAYRFLYMYVPLYPFRQMN